MNASHETEIKDVKDLRRNYKNSNSTNNFRKAFLFGYNVKEIDDYIASIQSNRELEKTAFLDRISELELNIKSFNNEKKELEYAMQNATSKLESLERENTEKEDTIKELVEKQEKYETLLSECEQELKKREDAVVFIENTNLKEQLSEMIMQRNEYAGQCETLKNENVFCNNKIQNLENEVEKLSEKLALEIENSRSQIAELSLNIAKVLESNQYFCNKTMKGLDELFGNNQNYKKEMDLLTNNLREKLNTIYSTGTE